MVSPKFKGLYGVALLIAATVAAAQPSLPAAQLYQQLRTVGLDPAAVYEVRDAAIDRDDLHLTLTRGTLAFAQAVNGRITAAFFEGDGDVLVVPPNRVERSSLAMFTGVAILEEPFTTAYLRFDDELFRQLKPSLSPAHNAQDFISRWDSTARTLAQGDALTLLQSLTFTGSRPEPPFLHARLAGVHLGIFDLFLRSRPGDEIMVGQVRYVEGNAHYDVWTAFSGKAAQLRQAERGSSRHASPLRPLDYRIRARIVPPSELQADTVLTGEATQSGARTLLFELSRDLQVSGVTLDGHPVEFLQNPAMEGTELAQHGNDQVAVVLPQPLVEGQGLELRFTYAGNVLSEAGGGLMYVGARGTWYPNNGPAMARFELEFRYPPGWTLVATGKLAAQSAEAGDQISRWVSERPIPLAGFNLGRYAPSARARSGAAVVETYAARGVERTFPVPPQKAVNATIPARERERILVTGPPPPPDPASEARPVAERTARSLDFLSQLLGPFPYSTLSLTQMPGKDSLGWPGLVFLSSYAFLGDAERQSLHMDNFHRMAYTELVPAHEAAHQWWGDLVTWSSYRDLWLPEALANYSALMLMESRNQDQFHLMMDYYRDTLLTKSKEDRPELEAGPVTLGPRVASSHFPNGYEIVLYGRGSWLIHMLRNLLDEPEGTRTRARGGASGSNFHKALRAAVERFAGRNLSTADLESVFEQYLPVSAQYEGKRSLAWFFDGWVDGTAIPRLALKQVKFAQKNGGAFATGTLVQEEAPSDLVTLVPMYASVRGKSVYVGRVFADGNETPFHLPVPAGAQKLLLDPYHTVLSRP